MPGKVKVKIIAGRNLPVMDRSSDTTDAYVEIKLGNTTYKTDVCRKSLNPRWNSEWYRFEVDDSELQDEPLQIRLMDYDMYSANDAIGKVYLDLNPLLLPACPLPIRGDTYPGGSSNKSSSVMSGWIPVYDTMHGIRGEVNITVKVELFSDFNKFRQSSCGVQFFYSSVIPFGYNAQIIHGFVEELVVNDDPEYHWIDKIRTPRASNEARQTLFFKLSGELQRKIGLKALDMGSNAVIGYHQCFDLEGESGIVARGVGTAVTLIRLHDCIPCKSFQIHENITQKDEKSSEMLNKETTSKDIIDQGHHRTESVGGKSSKLNSVPYIHRRSSDSDLSITPKGNSLSSSERPNGSTGLSIASGQYSHVIRSALKQDNWEMLEYPFLTMSKYPPGFIIHLGGTVNARSVKLLERISNPEEPESRDSWWTELRMEIRSHARALACNAVLAYREDTSICDDVCVLSASGTAAVISLQHNMKSDLAHGLRSDHTDSVFLSRSYGHTHENTAEKSSKSHHLGESPRVETVLPKEEHTEGTDDQLYFTLTSSTIPSCTMCHVPYCETSVPFPITMVKCAVCKHGRVPDVLITTIEMPDEAQTSGRGCLIQAHVCRPKRDLKGELNAKEISDGLPFLEYELHRLLINKLKVKGMNTIFGLKVKVSIGEKMLVGIATGTGVFLLPLPWPMLPKLVAGSSTTSKDNLTEMQKLLCETVKRNKEIYQVKPIIDIEEHINSQLVIQSNNGEEEKLPKLDLTSGNKDSCVLEIDDSEDVQLISLLMESCPPEGFYVVNTEHVPGFSEADIAQSTQMFTQLWRVKLPSAQHSLSLGKHFERLLQSVYFKLRRMTPCILCKLKFKVDIPEQDEVQFSLLGMALSLDKSNKAKNKRKVLHSISKDGVPKQDDDDIFCLEEEQEPEIVQTKTNLLNSQLVRYRSKSPIHGRSQYSSIKSRPALKKHGVDISPLSYIPGGKIKHYLGNLNFFFIRESTSIREVNGLSGFTHSFVAEVLAIVRAHITALGGNAMVAYFMTECVLFHNPHKNQGQCLINVGGDVVFVSHCLDNNQTGPNPQTNPVV